MLSALRGPVSLIDVWLVSTRLPARYFLTLGAVADQPDDRGKTPQNYAAAKGHAEVVAFFADLGRNGVVPRLRYSSEVYMRMSASLL